MGQAASGNFDDVISKSGDRVKAAFAGDQTTLDGIQNIVNQLESETPLDVSPEALKQIETQAKAAKLREENMTRDAERRSQAWVKKATAPPALNESADDFIGVRPPEPKVYGWDTAAMASFLQDPDVLAAWHDRHLGVLLRAFLNELKGDPGGQHGVHPNLGAVLMKPNPKDLLDALRKERRPRKDAATGAVPEYYAMLDVGVDATYEEIRKAYRKQALKWHPDKNRDIVEEATERFRRISVAFDTLFDPVEREKYDSGEANLPQKAKKLTGAGWANKEHDDEDVLAKAGLHLLGRSWTAHHLSGGRIDDTEEDLIVDRNHPGFPALRKKLFWRLLGELAYEKDQEEVHWINGFLRLYWKDTPSRFPKPEELKTMSPASVQEWKERRMVYNRRKQKIQVALELQQQYLDIPDVFKKEKARMQRMFKWANNPDIKWNV